MSACVASRTRRPSLDLPRSPPEPVEEVTSFLALTAMESSPKRMREARSNEMPHESADTNRDV